jgi:hypothetical protein
MNNSLLTLLLDLGIYSKPGFICLNQAEVSKMDYSKFTEIYGVLRANAARFAAIFYNQLYSTAHRPATSDQNCEFRWREKIKTIY